jgi:glyoxylate utilization-related uncharacterized protein
VSDKDLFAESGLYVLHQQAVGYAVSPSRGLHVILERGLFIWVKAFCL